MTTRRVKDMAGLTFDRLTVVSFSHQNKRNLAYWNCICSCGKQCIAKGANLRIGYTKSCGCIRAEKANPFNGTHIDIIWRGMLARCNNPKATGYKNYGGRGITVCERWLTFSNFLADMGLPPEGTTLDRRDNDKGYSKSNCRWATADEQHANKRNSKKVTAFGQTKTVTQWARYIGIDHRTLYSRLHTSGWPVERALAEGVRKP